MTFHFNQDEVLPYCLAILFMPHISTKKLLRWLTFFSDLKTLFHAAVRELKLAGLSEKEMAAIKNPNWQAVEKELTWLKHSNHSILTFFDDAYPLLLKEISYPPLVLYVKGNIAALSSKQIAMVGSRHPTSLGMANAHQFAMSLVNAGWTITSGLALGIDAASHRGALVAKGLSIGVCATGLKHIYPRSHRALAQQMLDGNGALISEFTTDTLPHPQLFPRRNRIISGLSLGVLVVEAALQSGSILTAKHALDQGREVFAIPGSIHSPLAHGCHQLIQQGAKLVETIEDILEEFTLNHSFGTSNPAIDWAEQKLTVVEKQILNHIDYEITPLDVILLRGSGLTASEVSSILLVLELKGLISSVPGGYLRITK